VSLVQDRTYGGGRSGSRITPRHVAARHCSHLTYFLRDHSQLLEVDETVDTRVIAEVYERQVFLYERKERNLCDHQNETEVSTCAQNERQKVTTNYLYKC